MGLFFFSFIGFAASTGGHFLLNHGVLKGDNKASAFGIWCYTHRYGWQPYNVLVFHRWMQVVLAQLGGRGSYYDSKIRDGA